MQVDTVLAAAHDLAHEDMRQLRAERAALAAGKAAVEVTTVRQVAAAGQEAEAVHHRDRQQRATQALQRRLAQQSTDHFHADDLVAVDGRTDEHHRARPRAMDDMHRKADRQVVGQHADWEFDGAPRAGGDVDAADMEGSALLSPCHGCGSCPGWRCSR